MLLQHEAKPDSTEIRGDTALIAAVQRGQVPCIRLLLQHNASVNVINSMGNNALHEAMWKKDPFCVKLLLDSGCDPTVKNKGGETVLEMAKGFPEIQDLIKQAMNEKVKENSSDANKKIISVERLLHICRIFVRAHLKQCYPGQILFFTAPKLPLPSSIISYLLYHQHL